MNEQKTSEPRGHAGRNNTEELLGDLGSHNKATREKAHVALMALGESVVSTLVRTLSHPNERVRWEAGKILDELHVAWAKHADKETVSALVNDLGSQDGMVRVRARGALVTIGARAVSPLVAALGGKDAWQRWEAAKALCQIADPAAIKALISALEDDMFDVRWVAAEGLISIGYPALGPLLHELRKHPDALWLREGAHRIFHGLYREENKAVLSPVFKALEGPEPALEVPFAARTALEELEQPETGVSCPAKSAKCRK